MGRRRGVGQKDRERAIEYLRREVRAEAFDDILLFLLNDFEESEKQEKENILDYLQANEAELYCKILHGIMKDSYIFYFNLKLFLDKIRTEGLILFMDYLEDIIEGLDDLDKGEPLTLHAVLSMQLMARSLDSDGFVKTSMSSHINKRLAFMEGQDEDPERSTFLRRFLATDSGVVDPREMAELVVESVDMAIKGIKNVPDPVLAKLMLGHQIRLVRLLFSMKDLTRAQEICRKLIHAFPRDAEVEQWFLLSLALGGEVEDVFRYVSENYSQEEIDDRSDLLIWMGAKFQKSGEMAKALSNMKRAYELSDADNKAFYSYVTVLLQSNMHKEAVEVVEDHILSLKEPLTPLVILLLSSSFITVDTATVDRLLLLFEETYPDELENLFISMPIAANLSYLHVLYRLQIEKGELKEGMETLERMVQIEPEYLWPHIAMALLFAMKDTETHDLHKALKKAEDVARWAGGSPKGLIGMVYLGSGQPDEAIQSLSESLDLEDDERLFDRIEAHRMLSLANYLAGDSRESCAHAKEWISHYNEKGRVKELFSHSATNLITSLLGDRTYIRFIHENCADIAHQVEHIIDKWKSWDKVFEQSFIIQAQDAEIESLKLRIKTLEEELLEVKEEYRSLDSTDEERLEPLINDIFRIEGARVRIQQELNFSAWEEIDGLLDRVLPGWDKLGVSSRNFIKTAEFGMDTIPREADFSGPIIYYAKAFEAVLHDYFTEPFREEVRRQHGAFLKDWDRVSNHMKRILRKDDTGSLTIGQWAKVLDPDWKGADKYERMLKEQVKAMLSRKDVPALQRHAEDLARFRNGSAHLDSFSKQDATDVVIRFREALGDVIGIIRCGKSPGET